METVILVLAHNEAEHIARTINSIVGQDNVEVVFVDDASTDDTARIAKEALQHSGLKFMFIQNVENLGVVHSAVQAFNVVSGRDCFIMRLDGDDELLPGAVENLKAEYKPGTFVAGPYIECQPSGEVKTDGYCNPVSIYECLACGVLMRVQDIKKAGGFARFDIGMFVEYDLYTRLLETGVHTRIIDEPVYLYNRHQDSMTTKKDLIKDSIKKLTAIWGPQIVARIRKY